MYAHVIGDNTGEFAIELTEMITLRLLAPIMRCEADLSGTTAANLPGKQVYLHY